MAEMLASASTGVMNSLLGKLASITAEEYGKVKGVRKQVEFLHEELSSMGALLEDLADMEQLDNQTKEWRNRVRDMSYDIEDCLDEFMHRVGGPHDGKGLMRRLKTLRARHQLANRIQDLKCRVEEANARHMRYKLDECMSISGNVLVDPRITAIYAETSSLVGIDGPKEEVIKMLGEVDDASVQELRVVSIMGFGGLGKTTLANEVYRKLGACFSCKAFISVSQRPDMMSLLRSLFAKVLGHGSDHIYDLQGLIDNLREYLHGKRYLLVVDDLWDASAWEIIKCAFPDCHCGSIVLTTTRIEEVAVTCCSYQWKFVYKMKPLDDYVSRQLFLSRVFGSGEKCPEPFEEPCEKILHKCGGIPLAIITIASLLASQPSRSTGQWNYVLNSLRHNLRSDPTLEGMRQIMNLSYTHLPRHLKTCLLYIGMYPEDYNIEEDPLVMQWVAEGFISGVDERGAVEVAGSYLNELVNRSMIIQHVKENFIFEQPTYFYKVHDMVLDLILSKSREENFLCAAQNVEAINTRQQPYKTRRLSLQFDGKSLVKSAARVRLPHVRSLIIFGFPPQSLGLFELKFLRVLDIAVSGPQDVELDSIGKLIQLRYLRITTRCCFQLALPGQMSGLQHLVALIVTGPESVSVPQDIIYLPALSDLHFPKYTAFPDGIGNMKSLHTLQSFNPSGQSVGDLRAFGELPNLRVLRIWIADRSFATKEAHVDALLSSLQKLINCSLRILDITTDDAGFGRHDRWSSFGFPCSQLEQLHLDFWFPRMPAWVGQLCSLSSLKLAVEKLYKDDVAALAGLPALVRLLLESHDAPSEGFVFSSDTVFKALGYLAPPYVAGASLTFQAGAMLMVETLEFKFWEYHVKRHGINLAGIENLPNLKKVRIRLYYACKGGLDKPGTQAAIKSAFDVHPARSSIQFEFN